MQALFYMDMVGDDSNQGMETFYDHFHPAGPKNGQAGLGCRAPGKATGVFANNGSIDFYMKNREVTAEPTPDRVR